MINNQAIRHLFRPDLENPTADDVASGFQAMNLMARPWVEKDDITEAALWLASDLSRYVTGHLAAGRPRSFGQVSWSVSTGDFVLVDTAPAGDHARHAEPAGADERDGVRRDGAAA